MNIGDWYWPLAISNSPPENMNERNMYGACMCVYNMFMCVYKCEACVYMHVCVCVFACWQADITVLRYKHSLPCCAWPVCSPRSRSCPTGSRRDTPPSDGLGNRQYARQPLQQRLFALNNQAIRTDCVTKRERIGSVQSWCSLLKIVLKIF